MQLSHRQAVATMVAVTLTWSIAGVVTRHLEQARSFEVTFWRSLFTLLSLLVILPMVRGRAVFSRMREGGAALWLSGLCWSVMFTAFMLALTLMYGTQLGEGRITGTLVAFLVPMAGAVNWTLTQRAHLRGEDVDLMPAVLIGACLSSLVTLPLALPLSASPRDLGLLALLGVVQLAIPCALSVVCARVLKAPEISLLALLEVIFGILLAWAGAGEAPGATVLTGGALVLGALAMNELIGWRQRA